MRLMRLLREHTPRFHGNGFIQLPLPSGRRMHVWDPEMVPIPHHNATIHNHVWDLQSRILHGTLVHRTLEVVRTAKQYCTHDIYIAKHDPDRESLEKYHDGWAMVRSVGEYQMVAGSVYVFPAGQFHETEHDGITVTVIEKRTPEESIINGPLVVCPLGESPVDAFDPAFQPPQEAMWRLVDRAVSELSPGMRVALMESAQ